jgi:hypothetical protein
VLYYYLMFIISCGRFILSAHQHVTCLNGGRTVSDLHLALILLIWVVARLFCVVNRFLECSQHVLLQSLLLKHQSVLVPNEVRGLQVEAVTLHASIKQIQDVPVVGVIREAQLAAVAHELFELLGLVLAKFLDGHLLLLAFDVVVFLVLRPSRESLPRERSS